MNPIRLKSCPALADRRYALSSDHGNALQAVQNPVPGKRYKKNLHRSSLAGRQRVSAFVRRAKIG
jgi:hypothetical protein